MLFIPAIESIMDVVAHHVPNLFGAVRLFEKVSPDRGGRDLRYVLVLRYGHNFFLFKATEGDAVGEANHAEPPVFKDQRRRA